MNVTIYKKATDVSNGFTKDVLFCLERIKQGKSKETIEWLRTLSKVDYDKNKSKLPGVCFNGVFEYRSLAGIKEHSGLIILDFDKFESQQDAIDFKMIGIYVVGSVLIGSIVGAVVAIVNGKMK